VTSLITIPLLKNITDTTNYLDLKINLEF